jgi:hypothetical protein
MPSIEITPAGDQLFEVELRDPQGASSHTVALGDGLVERLASDGMSLQDVVIAGIEFLTSHVEREQLDREIDLGAVAERYEGFDEQVAARARELARQETAPPTDDAGVTDEPTGDERLLAEVKDEQARGEVDSGRHRI